MYYTQNKNARISSRVTRNNKLRTETSRRDSGVEMAVSTDANNSTRLFLDLSGERFNGTELNVELNGREARTLFRLLAKHYDYVGKTLDPVRADSYVG